MQYAFTSKYYTNGTMTISKVVKVPDSERASFSETDKCDTYVDIFATNYQAKKARKEALKEG